MIAKPFEPTDEQQRVIEHEGSAFVSACPGAGKTRVMVERARKLIAGRSIGRGIAFLSFTIAAVSELEDRLRREGLVDWPAFPHFIGTFDAFLWQFLIAPFGIDGCGAKPRLIPDKDDRTILPFAGAQALPLECFDRATGSAIPAMIQRHRFRGKIKAHETAARNTRARFLERGELDFVDARSVALARLRDPACGAVLGPAFAARFLELIVDEAQDCNPVDLEIIAWFKAAGVPVKVICDPNQAIYGFRGGVTRELGQFANTFGTPERLPMNGNFRSSGHIAKGVVALRAPDMRAVVDAALGEHREEPTAVHILSYSGQGVPSTIGAKFQELVAAIGLAPRECPVVSATRRTGANALGHPQDSGVRDLSYRLAVAVSDFHFSFEVNGRKEALVAIHRIVLELSGRMGGKTYHQHLADGDVGPDAWRPEALVLAQALRFTPERFATAEAWHDEARRLLAPLLPGDGPSINQRLRRNGDLDKALSVAPATGHPARTIHSVKGMEFPAICVVMSPSTAKRIVDFLAGDAGGDNEEERWLGKFGQWVEWSFCLSAARMAADRRDDEQETEAQSFAGVQGESGIGGGSRREDAERTGAAIRRTPEPDHAMEGAASRGCCRRVRRRAIGAGQTCGRRDVIACQDRRADAGEGFFGTRARQGRSVAERKAMIDRSHALPVTRQAAALGISRSSVYALPRPTPAADLAIMRRLDALHMDFPFAGSRMLRDLLAAEGIAAGRLHVATLMKKMGIEALYCRPSTSAPAPGHRIYPYLLRILPVIRPNQVWAMDITYVPMARGFVYLAAVVDWFSRRVLAWRVSITMEADFCAEALEEALARFGRPEIFNTDQGAQFTSLAFTGVLLRRGIAISMDGRGAWRDNVFVERLWRSIKYEEIYLHAYGSVGEARSSIGRYLTFYNTRRPHSRLGRRTPDQAYFNQPLLAAA